jgi:hypothetical protein
MNWLKKKTAKEPSVTASSVHIATAASPPDLNIRPAQEDGTVGEKPLSNDSVDTAENAPSVEESGEVVDNDEKGRLSENAEDRDLARRVSTVSNDDDVVYPTGFRLTVITISLCFAVFLVALDQTIIATAMYLSPLKLLILVLK